VASHPPPIWPHAFFHRDVQVTLEEVWWGILVVRKNKQVGESYGGRSIYRGL
jgi:hypothetical protein